MNRWLVAFTLMAALLVACSPSDIKASDYDQTCTIDDDCVEVVELEADGSRCSTDCGGRAINKRDKARYDEDMESSRARCGTQSAPFCESSGTPACVQGRCAMKP